MTASRKIKSIANQLLVGLLAATALHGVSHADAPQLDLKRVELTAGMHRIVAQVAANGDERAVGLMHRREMPTNEGMLFVFDQPDRFCFWMKNTLIPLSAAFIDDTGAIVNIADMQPGSTDTHCAQKPVRFVLEMNQGWFQKRGFGTGARIGGLLR